MNQTNQKTILVGVTDIFFYTKVRDALMSKGHRIERARTQQDIADFGVEKDVGDGDENCLLVCLVHLVCMVGLVDSC